MVDGTNVIDYVQLNGLDDSRNLNSMIADSDQYGVWSTNLFGGTPQSMPQGVLNQIYVSQQGSGAVQGEDSQVGNPWIPVQGTSINTPGAEAAYFKAFFQTNHQAPYGAGTISNYDLSVQAPYTPTRLRVVYYRWEANDPLVHYMTSDLTDLLFATNVMNTVDWPTPLTELSTSYSSRYRPWGRGSQPAGFDTSPVNYSYKDPLVYYSDDWDFPAYKLPGVGWIGRVHRGSPWQTVYLKASDILSEAQIIGNPPNATTNYIGYNTWELVNGNPSAINAYYTAPSEDRLLFDLFSTALNENATRGTLSVNVGTTNVPSLVNGLSLGGLAAWSALFGGVEVITNSASYNSTKGRNVLPRSVFTYTATNIQPAGFYNPAVPFTNLPPLVRIVHGINQTRANTNLFPLGAFTHAGDILAVPQLTEQSPFINTNGYIQLTNANDEIYEWLPQQTLSLLRCPSSPRYVIYCYGQALKPAPNGIYTGGGQFFGLVTNYQIVAETAARAVVRFNSMVTNVITTNSVGWWYTIPVVTNNSAVIEQFNVLPPD